MERKVHMDCKPAGLTTEVAGDCSNEHPETPILVENLLGRGRRMMRGRLNLSRYPCLLAAHDDVLNIMLQRIAFMRKMSKMSSALLWLFPWAHQHALQQT